MEVKMLEIRDRGTFLPCMAIRPVAENEAQRWLLQRDGYGADEGEGCVILLRSQCCGAEYDPFRWISRTMQQAHWYIINHWKELSDGDVVDVEFILGETTERKESERAKGM